MIDDQFKEEVRARIDIATVVGRYVALKPAGANLKGLCPFHKEKSPSFSVNPSRGFFHCFGCGKGGDVFSFITEIEGLSFPEALRMLAEEAGVAIPSTHAEPHAQDTDSIQISKTELLRIHAVAAKFFYDQIRGNAIAIEYFKGRGITASMVKEFMLGFAPSGWSNLVPFAHTQNITDEALVTCGLAIRKADDAPPYDRFRNRIMFTLFDITGKPIGFAGRSLTGDQMPKYLNSPETPLYHKSRTLYGLHVARPAIKDAGFVYIVEGYVDHLTMYAAGICNVVATSGTALTASHIQILTRFTRTIVLLFDGDRAGQDAIERAVFVAAPFNCILKALTLPNNHDPDSYIRELGADAFKALAATAKPAFTFLVEKACLDLDTSTPQGISSVISHCAPIVRAITDSVVAGAYIKQLAEKLDLREDVVYSQIRNGAGFVESVPENAPEVEDDFAQKFYATPEGDLCRILIEFPDLIDSACLRVSPESFNDRFSAKLFSFIIDSYHKNVDAAKESTGNADPRISAVFSYASVSPFVVPDPAKQLTHTITQLERKHLKKQIRLLRSRMKLETTNTAALVAELVSLSSRFQELDQQ